nr:MAG TPA: hypothetical protein [Caudoviricetes sp.]
MQTLRIGNPTRNLIEMTLEVTKLNGTIEQDGTTVVINLPEENVSAFVEWYGGTGLKETALAIAKKAGALTAKAGDLTKVGTVALGKLSFKTAFGMTRRAIEATAGITAAAVNGAKEAYSEMVSSDEFRAVKESFSSGRGNGIEFVEMTPAVQAEVAEIVEG